VTVIRIEDGHDPRLADYAGVRDPARLRDRGLFIAEGRFVVRRLLAAARVATQSLLLNEAALAGLADVLDDVEPGCPIYVASPAVIETATGFNMHRGCLAVAARPREVPLETALATADVVVVLERVVDPDNVGSVLRSAEAFGVGAVLLSPGTSDPFYRKAIRTSSGAAFVVTCAAAEPWPGALDRIRGAGFVVVGATPDETAVDVGAFVGTTAARGRIAVLLGTEGQGLTADALARTDVRVRIPMSGALDSLNIATAAGILLHRLHEVRQERARLPRP
jgi:tRNA G18 (ribose-2'-O)-methylase SpoU